MISPLLTALDLWQLPREPLMRTCGPQRACFAAAMLAMVISSARPRSRDRGAQPGRGRGDTARGAGSYVRVGLGDRRGQAGGVLARVRGLWRRHDLYPLGYSGVRCQ